MMAYAPIPSLEHMGVETLRMLCHELHAIACSAIEKMAETEEGLKQLPRRAEDVALGESENQRYAAKSGAYEGMIFVAGLRVSPSLLRDRLHRAVSDAQPEEAA